MNILFSNHIHEFVTALRGSGHHLFVPDNAKRKKVVESQTVHLVPDDVVTNADAAVEWLKANKIDVIYAQGRRSLVFFSQVRRRLGRRNSIKIIATCHTGYVWKVAWKALAFLLTARIYGDGVIFLAKTIKSRYSWFGILLGLKMWTVPNPVDVDRFRPDASCCLDKERNLHLGYVAIFTPNKAQDVLIEATGILHGQGYPVSLDLVGDVYDEDYYQRLKSQIARLSLQDFVTLVPGMQYEQIPGFLRMLDCYVCSSKTEVLPFNILEAMASGLPVVSSGVGGIPDLVQNDRNGYCVDLRAESMANAIRTLIDKRSASAYGIESRKIATEQFSNEMFLRRMNGVLLDLKALHES